MSVAAFEAAVVGKPEARFAIVSERLFFFLDNVGAIECRQLRPDLPEDPDQHGPIRKMLRRHVEKAKKPPTLSYFVLKSNSNIHLSLACLHSIHLDETGLKSFVLFDDGQAAAASQAPPALRVVRR